MMTHTPSYRRILNKLGYYNYHNAFINRHINQKGGWDSHLLQCRNYIIKALKNYNPDKVTVLGSGWLLELPLAEMIENNRKVTLIDIIHPPEVIRQAGNLSSVSLSEDDITGGLIEEVWYKSGKYPFSKKLESLESINIPEYKPTNDPGLVISLNVLTQLEVRLVAHLKSRSKADNEELNIFRSEVQKKHIDFLKNHNSILISDVSEVFTGKTGNITEVPTLMTSLPEGNYKEEWTWNFEQTGAYRYNSRSVMKVIALSI
jgi:hypothetical protein